MESKPAKQESGIDENTEFAKKECMNMFIFNLIR